MLRSNEFMIESNEQVRGKEMSENATVQPVEFTELTNEENENGEAVFSSQRIDLIENVKVNVSAILGSCEMQVNELFNLKEESIIKLDQDSRTPISLKVDDKVVALGELVVVDDNFGVQITKIIKE